MDRKRAKHVYWAMVHNHVTKVLCTGLEIKPAHIELRLSNSPYSFSVDSF